jgi:hypothetical protein
VFFETIATAKKQSKARQGKAQQKQKQNQYTVSSSNVGSYTEDGALGWMRQ